MIRFHLGCLPPPFLLNLRKVQNYVLFLRISNILDYSVEILVQMGRLVHPRNRN